MNSRQSQLLSSIIREYIETAAPIGSSFLVSKYGLDISSATVRNEMVMLEEFGYICQPHTSAGRVPTEKGYKFFVENKVNQEKSEISAQAKNRIEKATQPASNYNEMLKNLAKVVAELTEETVIVCFGKNDIYYTGISNFFRKPEFFARGGSALGGRNQNVIINIAEVVDELDESMGEVFLHERQETQVLIGNDNPFSEKCASIFIDVKVDGHESMFGLLGLMRMDYQANIAVMQYIKRITSVSS